MLISWDSAALCFKEVTVVSTKDYFASGCPSNSMYSVNMTSSEEQQLWGFATEISSHRNTNHADLSYSLCCHPARSKRKQILNTAWHSTKIYLDSTQKTAFNCPRIGNRHFRRDSIALFEPNLNALKDNSLYPALAIRKKKYRAPESRQSFPLNCEFSQKPQWFLSSTGIKLSITLTWCTQPEVTLFFPFSVQ